MRSSTLTSRLFLVSLVALPALASLAADPAAFSGRYHWATNEAERVALAQEVEDTVATLVRILRPIARPRLRSSTAPYDFIDISVSASNTITYTRAGVPAVQAPLDGKPVKWAREGGVELDVAFALTADGRLQQTLSESDGTRVHLYTLEPGRTNLTLEVAINSRRLDRPVKYKLTYVRQP